MANDDLISKWRRNRADLKPVDVFGELQFEHVNQMLALAYSYGLGNIFAKPGRPVLGGPGEEYSILSSRRMSPGDIERFCSHLWPSGSPITEMLQGKPLDFRYDLPVGDGEYVKFRISMKKIDGTGTNNFSISIRPMSERPPMWERLNIEVAITRNLLPEQGLIMFVGRTDSGKTTLQSSAFDYIGRTTPRTQKFEEYGAPIEYLQDDSNWPKALYIPTNVGVDIRPPADWTGSDMSFACKNAMRCGPTIVGISEARDDPTFRAVVEVALTGHLAYTTAHTSGPVETLSRMCAAAPPEQRDGFASEIITCMHMIVHQRLIPAASGGRLGVREFLVFDSNVKSELKRHPYKDQSDAIRRLMADADGQFAQRFDQSLQRLFEAGEITEATYTQQLLGLQTMGTL